MGRKDGSREDRGFLEGTLEEPALEKAAFPLMTERLLLRPWTDADTPAFRRLNADPRVMAFFPAPLSDGESDALLARIRAHQAEHGFTFWAVEDRPGGGLAGMTGLARVTFAAPFTPCVEIGWRFLPDYWGKGYALEAARLALGYGFTAFGLDEIVAFTTTGNRHSQGLMHRLGMTRDPADDFDHPHLPAGHPLLRHVLYRLSRAAWEKTRN